jgi:diguanylate cyclase (GGDEF)-like protein
MIPTVYDICVTEVISININETLGKAIKKMANSNIRTIVIENSESKNYHILTTSNLLEYKISNLDKKIVLKNLNLPKAKELDKNLNLLTILNNIDFSDEYMVITEANNLIGIVSYTDIVNNVDPQLMMERQTISSLIHQYKAITTDENSTTLQAIHLLKESTRDAILVLNKKHQPKGIFTTKDFIDLIQYDYDLTKPIKEYMTSPVDVLGDNTTISEAINYIKEKHYKRIVVVNNEGSVSGVITQKELLKTVYNKWIELIKEEGSKMSRTNEQLIQATSELKQKVSLDFLTKLYNRNKFEEFLDEEIQRFIKFPTQVFSLIILDIDNFKMLNDNFGHLFGDKILQEIAKILTLSSRDSDILARWGGEEFVVILPSTNIEKAMIFAEKLRSSIESFDFEKIHNITCSFGVSQFHNSDSKIELFKRADEALYKAKALGKNRVELEHL